MKTWDDAQRMEEQAERTHFNACLDQGRRWLTVRQELEEHKRVDVYELRHIQRTCSLCMLLSILSLCLWAAVLAAAVIAVWLPASG